MGPLGGLAAGLTILVSLGLGGQVGGLRVNLSSSAPMGLWRLVEGPAQLEIGQRVFVCLPDRPWIKEALIRGYLRYGTCPNKTAPLIKTIAGLAGQTVNTGFGVVLAGVALPGSAIRRRDSVGRPLLQYRGGTIPLGEVYIHSTEASSFDSRYFGPVPASAIIGLAVPVLTWVDPERGGDATR